MSEASSNTEHFKVIGTISEQPAAHGEIIMGAIPKAERFQKGLKNLLICFGIMLIVVFIPVIHLFAPIFFFALGIFLFFNSYLDDVQIASGELTCDTCKSKITVGRKPDLFPFWVDCPKCNVGMQVKKES